MSDTRIVIESGRSDFLAAGNAPAPFLVCYPLERGFDPCALKTEGNDMLSHVYVGARDLDRACKFHGAILPILGWAPRFREEERGWAGWQPGDGADRPLFLVGLPYDCKPADPGNGQMVALLAPSRAAVTEAYETAIANGGTCEGPPGLRPQYHPDYFGAYFRDTEGNKICICCHGAEA